ncbi:MAG: Hsp20 family protein [Terracidiphilus sp.]
MQDSAVALLMEPETSLQAEESGPLIEDVDSIYGKIASRAFEIYEGNGQLLGLDVADWLQAEAEFLHPLHIAVAESPEAVTIRADVPGFKEGDLKIKVEPRRVTITGNRETKKESSDKKTIYCETCADQIMRVVDLPAAVDTKNAKTTVKDGVLELDLARAEPEKH